MSASITLGLAQDLHGDAIPLWFKAKRGNRENLTWPVVWERSYGVTPFASNADCFDWTDAPDKAQNIEETPTNESVKARLDLLPPLAALAVGRVLAFGLGKHPTNLWKRLSPAEHQAAALRHIYAHLESAKPDGESSESHLAHAICRLAFAFELEATS